MKVETLARTQLRLARIALDATHVYFSTIFGGALRVPKQGGAVEILDASAFPPPGVSLEARRAYYGGLNNEPYRTGDVDGVRYAIRGDGVYRVSSDGDLVRIARSFPTSIERKVLVVDEARVYWLEPAASAVLSVPRQGGPVAYVCEAWVPVHYDLALAGDRVVLLDIRGALTSAPKSGGTATYLGSLDAELGAHRNGVWVAVEGESLYVVSDAIGNQPGPPIVIELDKPLPEMPDPKFDGRVVRVQLPRDGMPLEPHVGGLTFGTNVWLAPEGTPEESDLKRMASELEPLQAELGAGKLPLTIAVGGGPAATPAMKERADRIEAWVHAHLGTAVRVERVMRAAGPGTDAGAVDSTAYVGIDRRDVPAIFAP